MNVFPDPDEFATLCINKFKSLPKTGKPSDREWTVLSCIIMRCRDTNSSKVVALGTGTKCIGHTELCPQGLILNDSHAEVIARRAFLRYIYFQLMEGSEVFAYDNTSKCFKLKQGITFHFFSTHAPCGDGSIISYMESKADGPSTEKRRKLNEYEIFTGAKLIGTDISDPMDQDVGQLRTKPGRGIRTLSMSCSDKLSRWNILGIQGALLDSVLDEPIYIETFNFCGDIEKEAISRAIYRKWDRRICLNIRYRQHQSKIRNCTSNIQFEYSQSDTKEASPSSIAWCAVSNKPLEVAVCGKKQGVTKKKLNTKVAALKISKLALLEQYLILMEHWPGLREKIGVKDLNSKTYKQVKSISRDYQEAWKQLKDSFFQNWTMKPDFLLNFKLS